MNEIYINERLNCIRNEMSHLWGTVFVLGGGSIMLIFNFVNTASIFLAICGLILSLLCLNAYFLRRTEVFIILKELEKR